MTKKVHARGVPCHVNRRRWRSMQLSSTGNPRRVTCLRCKALSKPAPDGPNPGGRA